MSIADRVARAFPPLACVHGFRTFARRRVTVGNVTEHGLEAEVKGQRARQVRLHIDGGQLRASCTCAAKVLESAACRHVWAALLEVDRQGLLASLRTTACPLGLTVLAAAPPKLRSATASSTKRTNPTPARARARTKVTT